MCLYFRYYLARFVSGKQRPGAKSLLLNFYLNVTRSVTIIRYLLIYISDILADHTQNGKSLVFYTLI